MISTKYWASPETATARRSSRRSASWPWNTTPTATRAAKTPTARFKEINEAYSVLSDANKRAAYDRFGHAGVNGGQRRAGSATSTTSSTTCSATSSATCSGAAGAIPAAPTRGQDLRYDLEISLEQAYAGDEVEVRVAAAAQCDVCDGSGARPGTSATTCGTCNGQGRVRRSQGFFAVETACPRCGGAGRLILDPCKACAGHGQVRRERILQVRIPAGVDDGARIRLTGEGDAGQRGGPRGDLYIFVSVLPHELFERDGLDLLCSVPVPMTTAALGGEIEAPCLLGGENCDGEPRQKIKVPEGAQTGRTVRLRGRGMPSLRSRDRGDLVVELMVETPTKLTSAQKALLRQFADSCGEAQNPQSAGFFKKARRFWEDVTQGEARV